MTLPEQPARPRGSYAKGVARRQEILDRAIEVFAQRGGTRTSLRAIAQEVGVTHAALTHYFGSLEELLVAVYDESSRRPGDNEYTPGEVTPAEMMRRSAEENRAIPGMVQLYSTLNATAIDGNHPAAQAYVTERFADLRARLAAQVREQQASGTLRADVDADLAAALVIAASDGLQIQWLLDPEVDHAAALRLLDRLLSTPES
ncbi:MAG: transcriptional regulator [Microbacterium sp. SCN 70-200]|uniref:TetR/AcrR family transcriptional regulator n=1 Tax=unclassified Microbacterium TaxID=2609290 RepID=UPI0008690486|nr:MULTISPECIES: TetR/AcrR family transcriptional regulator [unclassified Microbacterium]MBN9214989.1 TetR/AcrR family transcriptional regulator [Microbacterium sp.]ODT42921.1 MAG: transcriptional regulator [Microbacterium sp. SCN 70-200]OJV84772.1 MAG: TetR family transcriptional regulator [Microbacterium sp. 70-16]